MKEFVLDMMQGELDPEQRRAVWRTLIVLALFGHIFWACGWVPIPGIENYGFAKAGEMEDVREEVNAVDEKVENLRTDVQAIQRQLDVKDLELAQERICNATKAGNREAVRYAAERKTSLIRNFIASNGRAPYVPTCEELGINGVNNE